MLRLNMQYSQLEAGVGDLLLENRAFLCHTWLQPGYCLCDNFCFVIIWRSPSLMRIRSPYSALPMNISCNQVISQDTVQAKSATSIWFGFICRLILWLTWLIPKLRRWFVRTILTPSVLQGWFAIRSGQDSKRPRNRSNVFGKAISNHPFSVISPFEKISRFLPPNPLLLSYLDQQIRLLMQVSSNTSRVFHCPTVAYSTNWNKSRPTKRCGKRLDLNHGSTLLLTAVCTKPGAHMGGSSQLGSKFYLNAQARLTVPSIQLLWHVANLQVALHPCWCWSPYQDSGDSNIVLRFGSTVTGNRQLAA